MLDEIMSWVSNNSKSIGASLTAAGGIIALFKKLFGGSKPDSEPPKIPASINNSSSAVNNNHNSVIVNNLLSGKENNQHEVSPSGKAEDEIERAKQLLKILFIDDDVKFKVVTILKKAGWNHVKSVKDIDSTDCDDAKEAHVFFVDIQGVGITTGFRDEGLGLALALKKKYPNKKVIIYSAEQSGERFHPAFNAVDYQLAKNADPYEFQNLVEGYSQELLKS